MVLVKLYSYTLYYRGFASYLPALYFTLLCSYLIFDKEFAATVKRLCRLRNVPLFVYPVRQSSTRPRFRLRFGLLRRTLKERNQDQIIKGHFSLNLLPKSQTYVHVSPWNFSSGVVCLAPPCLISFLVLSSCPRAEELGGAC